MQTVVSQDQEDQAPAPVAPPLFQYQIDGAKWLTTRRHALLADEMGLGKSAQAITACDLLEAVHIVVICPASVKENWYREFELFSTRSAEKYTLGVYSYNKAESIKDLSGGQDVLIIDEAHYLKSPKAKRTKVIYGKNGLIHKAKRVFCLTGTPAPNNASELWTMLFTFGVVTQKFNEFAERFCNYYEGGYGRVITGTRRERIPELRNILSGVMLRRQKVDVMKQLPDIFYQSIVVEPCAVDWEMEVDFVQYLVPVNRIHVLEKRLGEQEQLLESMMGIARTGESRQRKADIIMGLEAMAQSVSTLRMYNGIRKLKAVGDLVEQELKDNAYEKVVIFAVHRAVIEGLRRRLRKFVPVTIYGGTPYQKRQANIDKFQKNKACRVFIGNIQSAGTGITLTAAHNVIFAEQDWVPGNNAQAAMRCHRIGQTKPVTVRFVGLANSIDERIAKILTQKTRELTQIFDRERLPLIDQAANEFDDGFEETGTIFSTSTSEDEGDIFS